MMLALLITTATGAWAQDAKHLIKATHGEQTRLLEQPLPYATTIGELYEAVTGGQSFSDLISTMSASEMPLTGISSRNTSVASIGDLNGASTPVTVKADGETTISLRFGSYAQAIYISVTSPLYVTMKEGTEDAAKWTATVGTNSTAQPLPVGGLSEGDQVTLKYTGRLKVKGVKATSDEAAEASVPDGALSGVFSVSDTKKVNFSKGNLQATYNGTDWTWAFAKNQWDYIGNAAGNTSVNGNGTVSANGTVDLFGWVGASNTTWTGVAQYGISNSTATNNTDGYGNVATEALKSDWGNTIGTGWFTLSKDEWTYLFNTRTTGGTVFGTAQARYAHATINTDGTGVNGMILFPDGVDIASTEVTTAGFVNATSEYATKCTTAQWAALAAKGCVFLPAAGGRNGASVDFAGSDGYYWSSSPHTSSAYEAYHVGFYSANLNPAYFDNRNLGFSVRLVREVATSDAPAAGAKAAKDATAEDLGKVIGADGYIYDNVDAATAAGTAASAIIAYVGTAGSVDESSSTYKGLAIALTDANSGVTYQWCSEIGNTCVSQTDAIATAITYMDGIASTNTLTSDGHTHAAATAASSYGTARPSGVSAWFLPSVGQWNLIVQGLATKQAGSTVSTNLTTSANNTYKSSNLNSVITDAGGTGFQSGGYWSSTEYTSGTAWRMIFSLGRAYSSGKTANNYVRAVFAF